MSNSEQKFHTDKKPSKNYQKFRSKQGQGVRNSIGNLETECKNVNSGEQSKSRAKFPRKPNASCGFKSDVATGNERKLNEAVPGGLSSENVQNNVKGACNQRDKISQFTSGNDLSVSSKASSEPGIQKESNLEFSKRNKVNSSKATPAAPYRNPYKKKRAEPLLISFQDILSTRRIKRKTREQNIQKNKVQRLRNKELLSGNFLDSSNPKRSRGKHREIKKKKLSKLKLTVIKERIIKHKIREMGDSTNVEWINVMNKIDFDTEIKAYLNELQNKKLKNLQKCKNNLTDNLKERKVPEVKQEDVGNTDKTEESLEVTKVKVEEKEENLKNVDCKLNEEKVPEISEKQEVKFSSKFREYCDNIITPELNSSVAELIKGLVNLQDRLFMRDPIKAKVKRRHISGIREVRKYLILKRVKMIIIAPNLEKLTMEGSIYESIDELKSMANSQGVPYGFALDRYKLGRCTKKNVPVSAFAVLSYEGIEVLYENALHQLMEGKKKFSELSKPHTTENNEKEDENSKVIASLISALREGLQVSKEEQLQQDGS